MDGRTEFNERLLLQDPEHCHVTLNCVRPSIRLSQSGLTYCRNSSITWQRLIDRRKVVCRRCQIICRSNHWCWCRTF